MRDGQSVTYLHGDHLGSTAVTTGSQSGTQRYYPYGAQRSTSSVATPYRYTGQRWEGVLGLYDYHARWYDPALGRFAQPDPLVPEPGNPQSLNRYSYCLNNPVRYSDPTGHWFESLLDVASLVYDIHRIRTEGWTFENSAALAIDLACLIIPAGTGGGPGFRLAYAGGDVATTAIVHVPAEVRALQAGAKALQATQGIDVTQPSLMASLDRTDPSGKPIEAPRVNQRGELRRRMERAGSRPPEGMQNPQVHHDLPWKFKDWFAERGLDVNGVLFGRWTSRNPHLNWTQEYERAWERYIREHRRASQEEVLSYLAELLASGRFPSQ